MSKPTFTSLFSGIGGCDLGAIAAGFEPCESVEYDPQLAELHMANIGGKCYVKNILDVSPYKFERPDVLHASPPCPNFSTAKKNASERQQDRDFAHKIADFITVLDPNVFTLENVQGYVKSFSLHIILEALYSHGYWVNYQVLNAADFGVPQSRRRLILIALKGGFIPSLPLPEKHIGWYEAIADLIPTCDRRELADWQKNLTKGISKPFVMSSTEQRADTIRYAHQPIFTIKASDRDPRALIETGETIQLNLKCLAALQSFPKNYIFGDKIEPIRKGIGNSVPPLMYQKLVSGLISWQRRSRD